MKLSNIVVVCCLLTILSITTAAQHRSRGPTSAQLRASFLAAFGKDFELVKDEFKSRSNEQGGGTYWLAFVKPIHSGHFALQYRFKDTSGHYSHAEREIFFSVGPKGCRRGPPSSGVYGRFCMGDTIIVPVFVEGSTEHEFKLVKNQTFSDDDLKTFDEKYPEVREQRLNTTAVNNPSESLRYVGRGSHKMFHRSLGYTLDLHADFEAVKPGKFNLQVSSSPDEGTPGKAPLGSIPIIVVPREQPLTLIAGREETRGFTLGSNGEYLSSTSGNSYMTNLIILQPGDRISIRYLSVRRGGEYERHGYARPGSSDPAEDTKPVISVHPFALDTKYDFTAWLVDYLP